ncbi:MAG: NIPSNAP family protein, partial [Pseudomonadota bacterium]
EFAKNLKEGMTARERHSKNVGLWISIAGQPNEVSHLWVYESLNHRAEARAAATADPDWRAVLAKNGPLLEEMSSIVMIPTDSSPMQ